MENSINAEKLASAIRRAANSIVDATNKAQKTLESAHTTAARAFKREGFDFFSLADAKLFTENLVAQGMSKGGARAALTRFRKALGAVGIEYEKDARGGHNKKVASPASKQDASKQDSKAAKATNVTADAVSQAALIIKRASEAMPHLLSKPQQQVLADCLRLIVKAACVPNED